MKIGDQTKKCDKCKHFFWHKEDRFGLPSFYKDGHPSCRNSAAWHGVEALIIGVPLDIGNARSDGAACGPHGSLWESAEL